MDLTAQEGAFKPSLVLMLFLHCFCSCSKVAFVLLLILHLLPALRTVSLRLPHQLVQRQGNKAAEALPAKGACEISLAKVVLSMIHQSVDIVKWLITNLKIMSIQRK